MFFKDSKQPEGAMDRQLAIQNDRRGIRPRPGAGRGEAFCHTAAGISSGILGRWMGTRGGTIRLLDPAAA